MQADHRSSLQRRDAVAADLAARLPVEIEKVTWPLERLWALRDERLRALIRHAKACSPWHADRLAHVDPDTLDGRDLSEIPTMTKSDLMDNWDEIVTDRRVTLKMATDHLARCATEGHGFLLDEYLVLATGGTSGLRAIVVINTEWATTAALAMARCSAWRRVHGPQTTSDTQSEAHVTADNPLHGTAVMAWLLAREGYATSVFPPSLPLDRIVDGLNELQPTSLYAYPSMLGLLAAEARAGRLRITVDAIGTTAEPLLPETRAAAEEIFGVSVANTYGATEGMLALSNPPLPGLHIAEDLAVWEPIDRDNQPVPPGTLSAKVLITSVNSLVVPIIRYEVTDEVMFLDEPNPGPWSGRRIADIQGRLEDTFTYPNGVHVHPHVIRSALMKTDSILEYQVRQTASGIALDIIATGPINGPSLEVSLATALRGLGLDGATATVRQVDHIARHTESGKLKRFISL
jgi:phenylacetate-coenzyme A ligase PaaK-like adenylate-forming protein